MERRAIDTRNFLWNIHIAATEASRDTSTAIVNLKPIQLDRAHIRYFTWSFLCYSYEKNNDYYNRKFSSGID